MLKAQHKNEIYGCLAYAGIDAEGNIHIVISKKSTYLNPLVAMLKTFEGKEVRIRVEKFKRAL